MSELEEQRTVEMTISLFSEELTQFGHSNRCGFCAAGPLNLPSSSGSFWRADIGYFCAQETRRQLSDRVCGERTIPNLVVVVNRASTRLGTMVDCVRDFFLTEIELLWFVLPFHRQVYVFDSPDSARIASDRRDLDGGKVLPGFRLPLGAFFDSIIRPA